MKTKDLTGQRFGRLLVLSFVGMTKDRKSLWLCRCDCNNEKSVRGCHLTNGKTASCGCLLKELVAQRRMTHGLFSSTSEYRPLSEYRIWQNMKARCFKPKSKDFSWYGGRNIKICSRWLNSFENFFADMGRRPSSKHSIDRIDVNGDYELSNCRWATPQEQSENRRANKLISFNGKTQCMSAWDKELNFPRRTIDNRLRRGWTEERALTTTPIKKQQRALGGKEQSKKIEGKD